jgi:TPP-dependent indolepyruvate ferredoxin oxidoreductase alpha subunit
VGEVVKALQPDFLAVVDPFDLKQTREAFKKALSAEGVSVVVVKRLCTLVALRQRGSG